MSKNIFNSIQLSAPKKNVFDLTHDVKLTLDMGELVPIMALECIPGDKFDISAESLLRFAPLVAPVMHRMDVTMHYFFVPNRLVWPGWERWITNDTTKGPLPVHPYINYDSTTYTRLLDYLGLPNSDNGTSVSAIPMAAYAMIYNEYYRDQNLIDEVPFALTDGNNSSNLDELTTLRIRAWMHDYFTSALPFAQKGDPVNIPFGIEDSPVKFNIAPGTGAINNVINATHNGSADDILVERNETANPDIDTTLYADNSGVTGNATINDLRRAIKLQEWLERAARAGSRYVENILAFFNVKSPDSRLQRPEYITGTKSPVVVSEVLNTTGEDGGLPQGNMSGHAISVANGRQGGYFCQEHGYIIGIMSVMPLPAYQQGVPRHFMKTADPLSHYWPQFANIGEQEIYNQELNVDDGNPMDIFGYTPRYAEYKYMPSRVAGDFKTSLNYWHLGRIFSGAVNLNEDFIKCIPDKRIFAVTDPGVNSLYCHVLNKVRAVRAMPKFGTPQF